MSKNVSEIVASCMSSCKIPVEITKFCLYLRLGLYLAALSKKKHIEGQNCICVPQTSVCVGCMHLVLVRL